MTFHYRSFTLTLLCLLSFCFILSQVISQQILQRIHQAASHTLSDFLSGKQTSNLIFGSSSLERIGEPASEPCHPWLNRAIGGATLKGMKTYLNWYPPQSQTRHILLYLGENDLANSIGVREAVTLMTQNLQHLRALYPEAQIHVLGIKPSPAHKYHHPAFRQFNHRVKVWIEENTTRMTMHNPSWPEQQSELNLLFLEDGVHLRPAGYRLFLGELVKPCL